MKNDNSNDEETPRRLSKDDFLVEGLEEVQPAYALFPGNMYAGQIPFQNGPIRSGKTMFWMFEPDSQEIDSTLVLWLNGGPGCSSFNCGVMMEHSPVTQPLRPAGYCCLKPTPDLSYNNQTWTKATTMLYVEHPVGTGWSQGSVFPEDETDASGDLYAFLQEFYNVFPHLATYDFFVMGESYAGMFVPSIVRYFHRANLKLADTAGDSSDKDYVHVPLAGGAMGNGWIDAKVQGPACIDYSWWHGLIDQPTRDNLMAEWETCLRSGKVSPPFHPFNVQDDCGMMWGILEAAGNPNAYDVTTWDPNVDQVTFTSEAFYNSEAVKKALHAPDGVVWKGCQGFGRRQLNEQTEGTATATTAELHRRLYMDNDRPLSMGPYMEEILDAGIPLLVYNGDRDMTTNMVGTELVLNAMKWKESDHWLDASRGLWMANGYEGGWAKELGPLTFVVVYNSGHMVPYNQPGPSYDLLVRFLTKKGFVDIESPLVRADKPPRRSGSPKQQATLSLNAESLPAGSAPALLDSSFQSSHFQSSSPAGFMMGLLISFIVGAVASYITLKKRSSQARYEVIPEASS